MAPTSEIATSFLSTVQLMNNAGLVDTARTTNEDEKGKSSLGYSWVKQLHCYNKTVLLGILKRRTDRGITFLTARGGGGEDRMGWLWWWGVYGGAPCGQTGVKTLPSSGMRSIAIENTSKC